MSSSRAALGLVVLLLAGLWFAGGGSATPPPSAAAAELVRVSEPIQHDNLTVYFIHGKDTVADAKVTTLQEALEAGWAVVHETGTVNSLEVENRSADTELFIQEGDIIKGGKQDRLIAIDMLLPPNSGRVSFPAHCVEQGRWTGRGQESSTTFHASTKFAVSSDLRYANATYQQGEVWKNVALNQDKLSHTIGYRVEATESKSSLQLALENPAVLAKVGEYEESLRDELTKRKNVVGVVFVVNGKMTSWDTYGSSAIFQKAWPKLLNSAATEALAEKNTRSHAAAPSAKEVERFLACGGGQQASPTDRAKGREQDEQIFEIAVGVFGGEVTEATRTGNRFSGRSGATRNVVVQQGGERANPASVSRGVILASPIPAMNPAAAVQNDDVQAFRRVQSASGRDSMYLPQGSEGQMPGNRLHINRVGNAAGLVTESRDAGRGNAIIHKSYIKR